MPVFIVERMIEGKRFSRDEERFFSESWDQAEYTATKLYGSCEVFECNPNDDEIVPDDIMLDVIIKQTRK